MNVALDTHRIVKRLIQAGFSDVQAETVTDVVVENHQTAVADLATKSELLAVKSELKADLAGLRSELKADIAELRADLKGDIGSLRAEMKADKGDMLKWGIGILFVQGGILLTLMRVFVGGH
jgi:hypothetical protein